MMRLFNKYFLLVLSCFFHLMPALSKQVNAVVYVNTTKTVHIVLGVPILAVDVGSKAVLCEVVHDRIQLKAGRRDFEETNLLIETDAGYATFIVRYQPIIDTFFYDYGSHFKDHPATLAHSSQSDASGLTSQPACSRAAKCRFVQAKPRRIRTVGVICQKMSAELLGLYTDENALYMCLQINNDSGIDYAWELMCFYLIKGKKKALRNTHLLQPLYVFGGNSGCIGAHARMRVVVVFDKMSLAVDEAIQVEIKEKTGGRVLSFSIPSKVLNNAQRI